MSADTTPTPELSEAGLRRRHLLRGGAVLAGAAGLTAVAAAVAPTAEAADGDNLVLGEANSSTSTTGVTIAPGSTPVLTLTNTNGPALSLPPVGGSWNGELGVGEIANTEVGPYIGLDPGEPEVNILATGLDLDALPLPVAITPQRILDTRSAAGRAGVVGASPSALDSSGRLRAGAWIDVAVADSGGDFEISAAFLNAVVTGALANGYLTVYPSGPRPGAATLNFPRGQVLGNGTFVATGEVAGAYTVRVYSSVTTHVVLELTGVNLAFIPARPVQADQRRAATVRRRVTRRPTPKLRRAGR